MAGTGRYSYDHIKAKIKEMAEAGRAEKEIADELHMTIMSLRCFRSASAGGERHVYKKWAERLKEEGKTVMEISEIIGRSESSVRLLLAPAT